MADLFRLHPAVAALNGVILGETLHPPPPRVCHFHCMEVTKKCLSPVTAVSAGVPLPHTHHPPSLLDIDPGMGMAEREPVLEHFWHVDGSRGEAGLNT